MTHPVNPWEKTRTVLQATVVILQAFILWKVYFG